MKYIKKYCIIAYRLSKKYFWIDIAYIFLMSASWVVVNYSLKMLTNVINFQISHHLAVQNIIFPILLYFISAILLGGNFQNFENFLKNKLINPFNQFIVQKFFSVGNSIKQDMFNDSEFYNKYIFVKNNLNKVSEIIVLVVNGFWISFFNVLLSSISIILFDYRAFLILVFLSIINIYINNSVTKRKMLLEKSLLKDCRTSEYYSGLLCERKYAKELRCNQLREEFKKRWYSAFKSENDQRVRFIVKSNILDCCFEQIDNIMNFIFIIYLIYSISSGVIQAGDAVFLQGIYWVLNYGLYSLSQYISKQINENILFVKSFDDFVQEYEKNIVSIDNYKKVDVATIKLCNVSYRYPSSNEYAIHNINMNIKEGEVICIIGDNGSGKSTLAKIISGILKNYIGEIFLDDELYTEKDNRVIYDNIGVAFQEFGKFALTIKENIQIGSIHNIDDSAYQEAIDKANLRMLIDSFDQRDNTLLEKEYDENGIELSLGEWQKIVLARAYVKKPNIIILDEPTASIDPKEEFRIIKNFRNSIVCKSAILISHRIGFAKLSDKIYVMKNGNIIEEGSHDELLAKQGEYYHIYETQKKLYV